MVGAASFGDSYLATSVERSRVFDLFGQFWHTAPPPETAMSWHVAFLGVSSTSTSQVGTSCFLRCIVDQPLLVEDFQSSILLQQDLTSVRFAE